MKAREVESTLQSDTVEYPAKAAWVLVGTSVGVDMSPCRPADLWGMKAREVESTLQSDTVECPAKAAWVLVGASVGVDMSPCTLLMVCPGTTELSTATVLLSRLM